MPGKFNYRNFLKKLIDRIIYNLTGESVEKRGHRRKSLISESLSSHPTPSASQSARTRRSHSKKKNAKIKLPSFLNRLINPEAEARVERPGHRGIVIPPSIPSKDLPVRPSGIVEKESIESGLKPESIKVRQKKHRKRKSFLKTFIVKSGRKRNEKGAPAEKKPNKVLRELPGEGYAFLNSLGLYMLAYLTVYLIYQLTAALVASNFGIDSVLYYYELYFPIGNASPLWTRLNIIAITLASPFISVLISIIVLKVVLIREKLNPQLRLFLIWVVFHGAAHFLGAFVAGIITSQGFGYVANWLYMNVFFRILVSLIFLFLLTLTGYSGTAFLLETIPHGIRQQRWRLRLALASRIILPWIIGGLLIIVVKFPDATPQHDNIMVYDAIIIATMGFMVIPAFFNSNAKPRTIAERPSSRKRPPGILIFVIAFVTLILFHLALSRGLHLVMNFSIDVSYYR